jgi:hypothetical protein
MEERRICCGEIIPEGRQVCPSCEWKFLKCNDADIKIEENHGA